MPDEPSPEPSAPPRPPPSPPKLPLPPLLDYPTRQPPPEADTERWGEFFRALLIVFGAIAMLFFTTFGLCGVLARGCG